MKKIILIIILSLLLIAAGIYLFYILPSEKELAAVRNMKIEDVNLQKVNDGTYEGDYSYGSYTYELAVSVKAHKIEKIDVISNRDTSHAKKAEGVISRVLEKQSANVDAVSGATTTSKALLKAIENALKSGLAE
jgi:uncharacterized protein with FMN-binding domain